MARFVKVPTAVTTPAPGTKTEAEAETSLDLLMSVSPEFLLLTFWPIMLGLFLAFSLMLLDRYEASRLVAVSACVFQAIFIASST